MRLVFMLRLKCACAIELHVHKCIEECIEVGLKHLWKELRLHWLSNNKYMFKRRLQCFCKDQRAHAYFLSYESTSAHS